MSESFIRILLIPSAFYTEPRLLSKKNMAANLPNHLRIEALSHGQKVCRLYKKACRTIQSNYGRDFLKWRFNMVLLRDEFDKNKDLAPAEAQQALEAGEHKCDRHASHTPMNFPLSPGGISYGREAPTYDYVLDAWHPLEKARYPEYFARRDVRKREFIERYEKKYGTPNTESSS